MTPAELLTAVIAAADTLDEALCAMPNARTREAVQARDALAEAVAEAIACAQSEEQVPNGEETR